ncbi:MAG: sigma-54 dependent transcriptional regulator [Bdellovibrionota bacterium]
MPDIEAEIAQSGIIGKSFAFRQLIEQIEQIKNVDATVLIFGESGTGKELVARAIHSTSRRQQMPFDGINCGAIPDNLLEAEFFGYKKGAFTDAKSDRKGLFESCSSGVLFLDEIGEIPIHLQAKLLRVLQEKTVRPLGGSKAVPIDARVICATNKNLDEEVRKGLFREDLYFRISVFPIFVPPLRERIEDIPLLVEYFTRKFSEIYNKQVALPSNEIISRLMSYKWPGNIRELQNSIERAVVFSRDGQIHLQDIFLKSNQSNKADGDGGVAAPSVNYLVAKEEFERSFLTRLLGITNGNISEAARISGRFRSDIYRLMEKYRMDNRDFR